MKCAVWRILRRPEYREDLDAIEAWIARDKVRPAVGMWLLIDDKVEQFADPNFPRRPSPRVAGAHELVAYENYIVYFDQDECNCSITVRAVVHVARRFPSHLVTRNTSDFDYAGLEVINPWEAATRREGGD